MPTTLNPFACASLPRPPGSTVWVRVPVEPAAAGARHAQDPALPRARAASAGPVAQRLARLPAATVQTPAKATASVTAPQALARLAADALPAPAGMAAPHPVAVQSRPVRVMLGDALWKGRPPPPPRPNALAFHGLRRPPPPPVRGFGTPPARPSIPTRFAGGARAAAKEV